MSAMQRPLVVAFVVGSLLTGYFFFASFRFSGFFDARTFHGRILGLFGFVALIGSLMSHLWERPPSIQREWKNWSNVLGLLSVWLILLHSHLHFGNGVATLAFFLLLLAVLSGGIATWNTRPSSALSVSARTPEALSMPVTRLDVRRERLMLLHIAATVGVLTFSLFHILAIWYY